MALILNWTILTTQIPTWLERESDSRLIANGAYIVMLAENRLASEIKGLGTQRSVSANFTPLQSWIDKPVRWRETISMNVGYLNTQKRRFLKQRTYEFCRRYWADPTVTGIPRYFSDWEWGEFLIVPTPPTVIGSPLSLPFELMYYERAEPLDASNETNWWTENAPEVLHACTMYEALLYIKDFQRAAAQEAEYNKMVTLKFGEGARRKIDRTTEAKEK